MPDKQGQSHDKRSEASDLQEWDHSFMDGRKSLFGQGHPARRATERPSLCQCSMLDQTGFRPGQILSSGLDQKLLWSNYECLAIQDELLYKRVGPLTDDGSRLDTVYVPATLRKEVICQCHDTRTAGHFYYWKTLKKVKKYFNWGRIEYRHPSVLPGLSSMCWPEDDWRKAQGRDEAI